ncbi:GntR family transcriptional regulator [Jiella endophytica]|uniref:GntR family transcriptional regulator n=1 Tax=Jiella endophytica TaxID=2558362 RepID=A0A4Y8RVA0_9HYPH|nr:GntR family transcriptional regulator [Jiella endophytica]TFF27692.1 GntR family transcriptional regulator [Jiella endophytica]
MARTVKPSEPAEAAAISPDEAAPRYLRIHRELAGRIEAGTYPVGALMPTETELGQEFATSRFTVREALRCLTEDGYVERRQGMGTRVVSARPQVRYYQSFESLQELFQVAVDTYMVVLGHQPVSLDAELAERVGGRAGERWIRVDGVRWTGPGGRPICYIESFVPERFEALIPQFSDHQGPFFDLLERHSREAIEETQQEIRALVMPQAISRQLGLPNGALSLQLLRRYVTAAGVLIASFNWHSADQMTYKMRIRRGRQPQE